MDYELARFIAAKTFRCSADLADLVLILKEHVQDEEEYKTYVQAIAKIVAEIDLTLLQELYARYPDIEREFQDNVNKYKFVLY